MSPGEARRRRPRVDLQLDRPRLEAGDVEGEERGGAERGRGDDPLPGADLGLLEVALDASLIGRRGEEVDVAPLRVEDEGDAREHVLVEDPEPAVDGRHLALDDGDPLDEEPPDLEPVEDGVALEGDGLAVGPAGRSGLRVGADPQAERLGAPAVEGGDARARIEDEGEARVPVDDGVDDRGNARREVDPRRGLDPDPRLGAPPAAGEEDRRRERRAASAHGLTLRAGAGGSSPRRAEAGERASGRGGCSPLASARSRDRRGPGKLDVTLRRLVRH